MKLSASAVFVVLVALGTSSRALAGQLGTVSFPTSATRDAQPLIERGVALMHSFQYDEAAEAFDGAALRDSRCAMCHWGKAMVLYQQVWQWPSPQDLATGLREIRLAERTGTKTARERAYIAAAAAFFQSPAGASHVSRIQAYSRRLASLHREYPADTDAAAFYALSLIALAGEDVEQLANLRRAIDILEPYLRSQPEHPGVAHYLIHAADMPELASRGLEAARKYATIAPDSSHALHMPSHIFVRLGLWQETIDLNLRAARAGARAMSHHHGSPGYEVHAIDYLAYAYLQSGQESTARRMTDISRVVGIDAETMSNFGAHLTARNALDLHRWTEAAALVVPNRPRRVIEVYAARVIGAARQGDVASARQDVIALRQAVSAQQAQAHAAGNEAPATQPVELEEGEAWLAFAEGRVENAIEQLRRAAEQEDADGGESVTVPAREMLADLLLEIGRPAEALDTYKAALRHAPNRFNSLYGAARAAESLADEAEAKSYFGRLIGVVRPGADRPETGEAKAFMAAH